MKKRVAYLVIGDKQFGGTNSGLNLTFDVPYTGTALTPNNATFVLTNTNASDTHEIVTNISRWTERRRRIECYAGYEDNVRQIFGGEILRAMPNGVPDTDINIVALSNIQMMGNGNIKLDKVPSISLGKLLDLASTACGFKLIFTDKMSRSNLLNKHVKNYEFTGSPYAFLSDVLISIGTNNTQSKNAIAWSVANDIMYLGYQDEKNPASIPIINKNSGLIGIPSPTDTGVNIQIIMDVSLTPLQTIYLESERLPLYNGLYNIINIRHNGELRGNTWYSHLECMRLPNEAYI